MLSTEQCLASSKILTPPRPHPSSASVSSSPRTKGGGGGSLTHSPGGEGGGGVNILKDARHWIDLLQYNPSKMLLSYLRDAGKICWHRGRGKLKNLYHFNGIFNDVEK